MSEGVGKPCGHAGRVEPGCHVCLLAETDPEYRRLYLGEAAGPPPGTRAAPPPARVGKCVHLGEPTGDEVTCPTCRGGGTRVKLFACAVHQKASLTRRVMGAACCAGCPDFREEGEVRIELAPGLPAAPPPVRTWAYGVTTIPARRDDLLPRTLASLAAAGFDRPRLFVDGADSSAPWERFGLPVTPRPPPPLRVHGNWVLSLHELFVRDPSAERFALFQDDVLCVRNLRAYLDRVDYPDGPFPSPRKPGYLSLYACPAEQKRNLPRGFNESNQNGRGALALVFSREALVTLLSARHLVERPCDPVRGWRSVDGGIVEAMKKAGWTEYVHTPSLVYHAGKVSSFDKDKASLGLSEDFRPYQWPAYYDQTNWPGEEYNALDLLR